MTHRIGIALSGGGSRAIAFHLGCLRALNDLTILERASILSTVSGGSVIGALYAYRDEPFESFEDCVSELLRTGFAWGIIRTTFGSSEALRIVSSHFSAGVGAWASRLLGLGSRILASAGADKAKMNLLADWLQTPIPRFASRSTAFERYLRKKVYGDLLINQVAKENLDVIINATELRTGTAFRFGSKETACWRFGKLPGKQPLVSKAVAASAAYPAFLPSFDEVLMFEHEGSKRRHRVILTDGGVYDNLGITCMLPDRSKKFSSNVNSVDFIIACDAGPGMPVNLPKPYFWSSRMISATNTIHRRTHSLSYKMLHQLSETGKIRGFLLPYLGQVDCRLPYLPSDLVRREEVIDYPTDFNAMTQEDIEKISNRGEQLTKILIDHYEPNI